MHRCESWTIKKVEDRRTDAFELRCSRRLLRVLWTAKRSNKSILKEICPEYSMEGLILNLKLQSFDHLMRRIDLLEKDPDAGRDWGGRRGRQRVKWLEVIIDSINMSLSKLQELVVDGEAWCVTVHQAPLSLGFSRQEHWSGLPLPSPMHESEKWKWSRSVLSDPWTPWTAAYQAPPSVGFFRQEDWSGVPLPSPKIFLTWIFYF